MDWNPAGFPSSSYPFLHFHLLNFFCTNVSLVVFIGDSKKILLWLMWVIDKPMVLQMWQPNMVVDKERITHIPVWVRLFNVPVPDVSWTRPGFSCVASAIGVPLSMDSMTLANA